MNQPVFHPLEGRADCVGCHGTGVSGAPELPQTHEGWPSSSCLTCHPPAAATSQAVYGTALPFALLFALGLVGLARALRRVAGTPRAAEMA